MNSNLQRVLLLSLLTGAAANVAAAPAPVSDLNSNQTPSAQSETLLTPETRLERLIESRNHVQLQLQQQLDQLTAEIQQLRGLVERNSYDIQQTVQRQRELFIELDNVRNQITAGVPTSPQATSTEAQGTYSENVDEQTAYQNAVDLILKKRDYSGAIDAFNQFRKQFPESTFTPNAHYWLGQLYFAKKQYDLAKASFESVVEFADSNKRADALVKLGDIAKRDNKPDEAKRLYQMVVDQYPQSASAQEAKSNLTQ